MLQFDSGQVMEHRVYEHMHFTPQHHSGVRTEHEFSGAVCDALDGRHTCAHLKRLSSGESPIEIVLCDDTGQVTER